MASLSTSAIAVSNNTGKLPVKSNAPDDKQAAESSPFAVMLAATAAQQPPSATAPAPASSNDSNHENDTAKDPDAASQTAQAAPGSKDSAAAPAKPAGKDDAAANDNNGDPAANTQTADSQQPPAPQPDPSMLPAVHAQLAAQLQPMPARPIVAAAVNDDGSDSQEIGANAPAQVAANAAAPALPSTLPLPSLAIGLSLPAGLAPKTSSPWQAANTQTADSQQPPAPQPDPSMLPAVQAQLAAQLQPMPAQPVVAAAVNDDGSDSQEIGANAPAQVAANAAAAPALPSTLPLPPLATALSLPAGLAPKTFSPWQTANKSSAGNSSSQSGASQAADQTSNQNIADQPAPQLASAGTPSAAEDPAMALQAAINGQENSGNSAHATSTDKPAPPASVAAAAPQPALTPDMAAMTAAAPVQAGNVSVSTAVHVTALPPGAAPDMNGLAVEIAARSQSGARQFDIRLDPPELGRVDVRLSIDASGKAEAHMTADQPQTLSLLQRDSTSLTQALRDAGLDVSDSGLNFSLRSHSGQQGQDGDRNSSAPRANLAASRIVDAVPAVAAMSFSSSGDARLDIHV